MSNSENKTVILACPLVSTKTFTLSLVREKVKNCRETTTRSTTSLNMWECDASCCRTVDITSRLWFCFFAHDCYVIQQLKIPYLTIIIIIILRLRSRRLQDFSRHFYLGQLWQSGQPTSRVYHTPTHDWYKICRMYEDAQVSFCHVVESREHNFWQVLPQEVEGCALGNEVVASSHSRQGAPSWSWSICCSWLHDLSFWSQA